MICTGVGTVLAKRKHSTSGGSRQHFTEADPKAQGVSNFLRSTQLTELREKSELPLCAFLLSSAEGSSHSRRTLGIIVDNLPNTSYC